MSNFPETDRQTTATAHHSIQESHHANRLVTEATQLPTPEGRLGRTSELIRRQMVHCGEYTYQALNKTGKLSPEDTGRITQQYLKYLNLVEKGKPFTDPLQYLALEGWSCPEMEVEEAVLRLTKSLTYYSKTRISHLAFAQHTQTPVEFYSAFPAISEICLLLGTPLIQVSDNDFFTITSINPFTAVAAARLVSNEIQQGSARRPFCFVTTTNFSGWKYLLGRHFGA